MTSKYYNPQFSPDMFSTLTIVNHCVTESGLESQLLNAVVKSERPETEQKRIENVNSMAESNKTLKELEDQLLRILS